MYSRAKRVKLTDHRGYDLKDFDSHFCYWLRYQEGVDNVVGDLASDYKRDKEMIRLPYHYDFRRVPDLNRDYLQKYGSSIEAIEAYCVAIKEFAAKLRRDDLLDKKQKELLKEWLKLNARSRHE